MTSSQRIKLELAYDGSEFSGWATQPGLRTVQGELETALGVLLRRDEHTPPRVTVAGRTDAGVHARKQVAHLDVSDAELAKWTGKAERLPEAERSAARANKLNGVLKRISDGAGDIVVWAAAETSNDFDARFSAIWRRYEYRVVVGECDPLSRKYTASVHKQIDFDVLQAVSADLVGLRDFSTFCKAREGATAVRHLTHFEWRKDADGVCVARIQADAFCHSMVRALVGAVLAAATGRISAQDVKDLTAAKKRSSLFTVMPAHGLSLEEIGYPEPGQWQTRAEQTRARREQLD